MAGKLFNIYSGNTGGVLSTSTTKVGSFGTTSDDFYSVNFDTGRKSIWTNNIEFGRAADWGNISDIPSWIGSDGVTWANVKDKPATATRWPYWSEILSKPAAIGSATQPVYWDGSTFQLVNSVAPASHDHDTRYVKLDGTNVMSGDLTLNLADLDRFIVFAYPNAVNPSSNSWRTGVLGTGSGENNFFVVQYQRINTGSSDWNTAFKIGQDTGTVTFTNNIKVGSYTVYHSGNLPAYPTVNNGALYLQASGTTKVTFTANQSGNSTFNIATGSANGTISVGGTDVAVKGLGSNAYTSTAYLPLAGGTMDEGAQIKRKGKGGAWIYGRDNALIKETSSSGYHPLFSLKTTDGSWELGEYNTSGWYNIPVFSYITDENYSSGNNSATYQIKYPLASGTIALTADLTWSKIADKPATATRWPSWDEVTSKPSSFTPAAHDHTYLKKNFKSTGITNIPFTGEQFEYGILTGAATGVASPEDLTAFDSYSQVEYINLPWYSNLYGGQLMFGANSGKIGYRTIHNGTWSVIKEIIHSSNYTDYTVKKDGTGATGTWGISITGNAGSADKLKTARTITINGSSKTFDGTGNISWSLADLNLPSNEHNHDDRYLQLSGGTLTGVLHLLGSQYADTAGTGALDLANSDIYGVNSIKFADLSDGAGEGLQWYRDATHTDSLWVKNGVIYFTPNRTWNGTGTNYTVWHSGNDGASSGLDADLLDGVHASGLFTNFSNKTVSGNKVLAATIGGTELTVAVEYAGSAGSANILNLSASIGTSSDTHATALQNYFNANKSSIQRNKLNTYYSSAYGNGSFYMGYFLSGYNDTPYGGFFIAHYGTPYYVGIANGTYNQQTILTSSNYTDYTVTKTGSGASGTWGISITGNAATADSAGNADTLDTFHATDLFQTFTNDATNNAVKIKIGNTEKSLVVGYATKAGDADKLDNIDSTGFLRYISHNAEWSTTANMPTNLTAGMHKIHVSGVEYSSVLTGYDYNGSYWQLWFHPSSGYSENIRYRATNCTTWKTILDSNNSSVSKSGETLSVKINGTTQSLTNTWRGITDSYNVDSPSSSTSLSQKGAKALYNALINGYANEAGNADTVDNEHAVAFYHVKTEFGGRNYYKQSTGCSGQTKDSTINGYIVNSSNGINRISNIGFNSWEGDWTVSFEIKADSAISVNVNLCDYSANTTYNEGSSISVTTSYVKHKFTFTGVKQYHTPSSYNGFLDIENSQGVKFYVKDIKIEKGVIATDWSLAPEDVAAGYGPYNTATYADSAGSASSVAWANITGKATSKTAWGQTFVDSNGDLQSISGNMTSVGQVTPDGHATRDNGTSSANWATVYSYALRSNDNLTLRSGTSKDIIFQTNAGTEHGRFLSGGTLVLKPAGVSNWGEGIRINDANNGWTTLALGGSATSGTSAAVWSLHTYQNNFYIANNGSSSFTNGIKCVSGVWSILSSGNVGIGTESPGQKLQVTGGNILQEGNNSWLTPARLQIGRPDTSVYTDRSCIGTTDGNLHLDPYSGKELYLNYYSNTGAIRFFQNLAYMSTNGHLYVPGYHFKGNDDNNYVLTAGGSYKQWSASNVASTIVARDANKYIYADYYNSNISDEDSISIGSVYVRNTSDNWIRRQSIGKFVDNLRSEEIVTIEKTLTVTEAWMDTGIVMNTDTFPRGTGTYAIQIASDTAGSNGYYPYYSGIMSIYTSGTNGTGDDEVSLHMIGHATQDSSYPSARIYIRTVEQTNSNGKIQIAAASNISSHKYTFKFRKLI